MSKITHSVDAVKIAARIAEERGFKMTAMSNLSEAVYLERPKFAGTLRIATHSQRHRSDVVHSIEFFPMCDAHKP